MDDAMRARLELRRSNSARPHRNRKCATADPRTATTAPNGALVSKLAERISRTIEHVIEKRPRRCW